MTDATNQPTQTLATGSVGNKALKGLKAYEMALTAALNKTISFVHSLTETSQLITMNSMVDNADTYCFLCCYIDDIQ